MTTDKATTPPLTGADLDKLEALFEAVELDSASNLKRQADGQYESPCTQSAWEGWQNALIAQARAAKPVAAWMTEDGERVVSAATKAGQERDGGASASAMRPYSVPLIRAAQPESATGTTWAIQSIDTLEFQALAGMWSGAVQSCDQWTRTVGEKQAWADMITHIDTIIADLCAQLARSEESVAQYQQNVQELAEELRSARAQLAAKGQDDKPVARLQAEVSDHPYSEGETFYGVVILDRARCEGGMELFAAPASAQPTDACCKWPTCQSEEVQQQVADQAYRELYSGAQPDRGAAKAPAAQAMTLEDAANEFLECVHQVQSEVEWEAASADTLTRYDRVRSRLQKSLAASPASTPEASPASQPVAPTLTKEQIEDIIQAVKTSMNFGSGFFFPRGWNVLLDILNAMLAAPAAVAPSDAKYGWKLVPIEPTQEMFAAARTSASGSSTEKLLMASYWRNMVAAAPSDATGKADAADADALARARALHAAVAAIYFDDSSDFRSALGSVVRHLDANLAGELLGHPKAAYDKACALLDQHRGATVGAGGQNG